ncbi:helix-turn-helix domain-containing protein [Christiangramia aquimixticola]|uniref:helix-turn-helix domain-containing protein n=1 Tax=Christiangramia aquimixticola TaxID=1697558 RepID=UPI003AA80B1E
MKTITQLYGITPEELKKELLEGISKELKRLSKDFRPKEPTIWITRKEASELLGVSLVTIHTWGKEGIITKYKIGNRIRFRRSDLEKILLDSNEEASK